MDIYLRDDVLVVETNGYDSTGPDTKRAQAIQWLREHGIAVVHDARDTGTL